MNFAPQASAADAAVQPHHSDEELLNEAFLKGDWLPGAIFRRVYGIDAQEHIDRFERTKILPGAVRDFCRDALAGTKPHFPDPTQST